MPSVKCPHCKTYFDVVWPEPTDEPRVVFPDEDELRRRARTNGADVDRLSYVQHGHGFGELPYEEEE